MIRPKFYDRNYVLLCFLGVNQERPGVASFKGMTCERNMILEIMKDFSSKIF